MTSSETRPYKKFFCDRDDVFLLPPIAFKIWMYHYRLEGPTRRSWPSRERLCKKLNISEASLTRGRNWLLSRGWLKGLGYTDSGIPVFRVTRGTQNDTEGRSKTYRGDAQNDIVTPAQKDMTEVDTVEVNTIEVEETNLTDTHFKTEISDKALEILGIRIYPQDSGWRDLLAYKRIKGHTLTIRAFDAWAKDHQGANIGYPLTEFVRVAEQYIVRDVYQKRQVAPLASSLATLADGQVTFNRKQSAELSTWLDDYSEEEIKTAFREFMTSRDDTNMKYASKDFSETAGQIIDAQRARKRKLQETEEQLELFIKTERQKVDEQLAKLPNYPDKIEL